MAEELRAIGATVREWRWRQRTPRGEIEMVNVAGMLGVEGAESLVLLGTHYDTKWFGAESAFVGANDGGSGVGLLLEMGRHFAAEAARRWAVWLLFFDGEEAVEEYGPSDGLYGSRHFAAWLAGEAEWRERVRAAMIVDMIGDADLSVTLPRDTPGWMARGIFAAAERVGVRDRFGYVPWPILDDHVPLRELGIPAMVMIDLEYGSRPGLNDYWHTERDGMERLSAASLAVMGQPTAC